MNHRKSRLPDVSQAVIAGAALAALGIFIRNDAGAQTPEQLMQAASAEMVRVSDELKRVAATATAEVKNLGEMTKETKATADRLLLESTVVQARLAELEQKMARRAGGADPSALVTLGDEVMAHDDVKAWLGGHRKGSVKVAVKNVITSQPASAGVLIEPQRLGTIILLPDRRLTVRDLIMPGRTTSNSLEYVRETLFTNLADFVSDGVQKPESNFTFALATANVRTIAHWVQATKIILDDAPQLRSYIDGRLRYGLAFREEAALLNGNGTGVEILGIIPQAAAFAAAFSVPMETAIDKLRLALLQSELAEYPSTGIVLHPTNWAHIELTKDADGRYIWANPLQLAGPSLWGKPVVATQAIAVDEFLAGAFRLGAQIFDREDATVEISTEDRDNFVKNMVTILCEERLALVVYRPDAFVTGDLDVIT